MELRTDNCGENCANCYSSSGVGLTCNTGPANCGHLDSSPTSSSSHYTPRCHEVTPENICEDCDRVTMPVCYRSNQDVNDSESQSSAGLSLPRGPHHVSSEMFSDRTPQPSGDDADSISFAMRCNNHVCVRSPWQIKRKIGDQSSALLCPSRETCRATVKHSHSIAMRKRGSYFKQGLTDKSIVPMDHCSADSRLFSSSFIHRLTGVESLTKLRSLKSVHRAESPSHSADQSTTTYDSEGTTLSNSPNDDALSCNKVRSFLSLHSPHRDKELRVDGNPALRSSLKPSSMTENAKRNTLDTASVQHDTSSLLLSSSGIPTTHGRLETEGCEETSPRNVRSFERVDSSKNWVPQREKVRKFQACGRRKLKRRRREYGRLRNMVPSLKALPAVSKVTLIEEAVKYIEELHGALIQRFRDRGLPPTLAGSGLDRRDVSEGNIRDLVVQLLTECNPGCLPPTRLENNRTKLKLQVSRPKLFDRRS